MVEELYSGCWVFPCRSSCCLPCFGITSAAREERLLPNRLSVETVQKIAAIGAGVVIYGLSESRVVETRDIDGRDETWRAC